MQERQGICISTVIMALGGGSAWASSHFGEEDTLLAFAPAGVSRGTASWGFLKVERVSHLGSWQDKVKFLSSFSLKKILFICWR